MVEGMLRNKFQRFWKNFLFGKFLLKFVVDTQNGYFKKGSLPSNPHKIEEISILEVCLENSLFLKFLCVVQCYFQLEFFFFKKSTSSKRNFSSKENFYFPNFFFEKRHKMVERILINKF